MTTGPTAISVSETGTAVSMLLVSEYDTQVTAGVLKLTIALLISLIT